MQDGKLYVYAKKEEFGEDVGCITTLLRVTLFRLYKYTDLPTIDQIHIKHSWQDHAVYPRSLFKHTFLLKDLCCEWKKVKGGLEAKCDIQVYLYFLRTPIDFFLPNQRYTLIFGVGPVEARKYLTVNFVNSDGHKGLRFLQQTDASLVYRFAFNDLTTLDCQRFNVPILLIK